MIELSHVKETYLVEGGVSIKPKGFIRNLMFSPQETQDFRDAYGNTGVYVSAYQYSSPDQNNALLYGDFYLDFDMQNLTKDNFEILKEDVLYTLASLKVIFKIDYHEMRIYFSGKKGFHVIIPAIVLGVEPDNKLNETFKLIALECHKFSRHKTIDTQIYDKRRMFRLPGSIHNDTGLYKIPITKEELSSMSLEDILNLAKYNRQINYKDLRLNQSANKVFMQYQKKAEKTVNNFNKNGNKKELDFRPPCIDKIINNPAPQGSRNNLTAILTSYAKQRGMSEEEAFKSISSWNEEMCSPPLISEEITSTIKSIYSGDYVYGCGTLQNMNLCDESKCKIGINRNKQLRGGQ